jgi:hypothetical protein
MDRTLLIIVVIIAVIAVIWYLRQQNAKAAEQRKVDEFRRVRSAADAQDRAAVSATAAGAAAETARPVRPGLLQEAADTATGREYEKAAGELEEMTADLARAREDADRAAARLAARADEALVAVQAAAKAHGGAVPGDGTHECPPAYPIKGNMPSMRYHLPGQPSYARTIAEVCFQNAAAAEAAGFTEAGDETGMRGGPAAVVESEIIDIEMRDRGGVVRDEVAAETVVVRNGGKEERVDVVAEAIAAADAGSGPPGAIRGDGSRDCPPSYPVKGHQSTMIFHEPGTATYGHTIPTYCFSSVEAAAAAGYREAFR